MYRQGSSYIGDWRNDIVFATDKENFIFGGGGNDVLFGFGGNDTIDGGSGNDYIAGGSGSDVVMGGNGVDTLSGGGGNDTFTFWMNDYSLGAGHADYVTDFNQAEGDIIRIAGSDFAWIFGKGPLDASEFCYAGQAYSGPHIIYDPNSGTLYLDADTSDNIFAQPFAYLQPQTAIDHTAIWFG